MASCDLCGQSATTKARIEGVVMSVCANCARFGTEFKPPSYATRETTSARITRAAPLTQELIANVGSALRVARQKRGLNEEDAAKALAITKTALLHYESGKYAPDNKTAQKLAKFYGIQLFE